MSAPSISTQLPDPFSHFPSYVSAPLSRAGHTNASQVVGTVGSQTVSATQLLAPLLLNNTGAGSVTITLPDSFSLSNAYGNNSFPTFISNQINSFSALPSSQVQVGDVFTVPLIKLPTDTGSFTISPGVGGSGSKTLNSYTGASDAEAYNLCLQFTAVGSATGTTSYVVF